MTKEEYSYYRKNYKDMIRPWYAMLHKCYNPKDKSYKYYGAQGIGVCKRWQGKEGFVYFAKDMNKGHKKGMFLERLNQREGFSKDNCVWVTMSDFSFPERIK